MGIVKTIIDYVIIPSSLFWCGVLGFFYFRSKKPKLSFKILIASLIWLFVTNTPFIPNVLVNSLESQYNSYQPIQAHNGLPILILGAGSVSNPKTNSLDRLFHTALARLNEGIRLSYKLPSSPLVFAGSSPKYPVSNAVAYRDAALDLGVNLDRIHLLEQPTTTEEEAQYFKKIYGIKSDSLILVTSDIHMPRAMMLFKNQGLNPIPAPANSILKNEGYRKLSDHYYTSKFHSAMHEYIGILWLKTKN
jgi:uncharacterized SAM-binding protein YcdF (DUF218 family)